MAYRIEGGKLIYFERHPAGLAILENIVEIPFDEHALTRTLDAWGCKIGRIPQMPRDIFDALPPSMHARIMRLGFTLFDDPDAPAPRPVGEDGLSI